MKRFLPILAAALVVSCGTPTGGGGSNTGGAAGTRSLAVSLDLTDAYTPGTILNGLGDDRTDTTHNNVATAHMAVNFWIQDDAGNYVKTVQYFLASETTHNTMAGTYTGNAYTHLGTAIGNLSNGIARSWLSKAGTHAGLDGITGATIYVIPKNSPEGHFSATWDGKDYQGNDVPSGTYHAKMLVLRHSGVQYGAVLHSFAFTVDSTNTASAEDTGFPLAYDSSQNPVLLSSVVDTKLAQTSSNFSVVFTKN